MSVEVVVEIGDGFAQRGDCFLGLPVTQPGRSSLIGETRGQKEAAAVDLESYLKAEPEAKNGATIRAAIAKLRGANK